MPDKPVIAQRTPCILEVGPGTVHWCRCGRSKTQPFCDGSHTGTEFAPLEVHFEDKKRVAFCGCKQTKKPPLLRRVSLADLTNMYWAGDGPPPCGVGVALVDRCGEALRYRGRRWETDEFLTVRSARFRLRGNISGSCLRLGSQRMRNKIPCTAERLSLLDPPMIQAVVDRNAFHIGNQYLSENRVRIVSADDAQISSAVIGNSGLYEQTIRLKEGHLVSKCSCSLPEEPMCRHCIAVLLEYHRWAQPRSSGPKKTKPSAAPQPAQASSSSNGGAAPSSASTTDLKLREVMAFVEWLQPAIKALEHGQPLPDSPMPGGELDPWIQAIRNLEERRRESEEVRINLESDMRDREAYVGRLTQQLQASIEEIKATQAGSRQLQQELVACKEMLAKVADVASEVGSYDSQLKSVAGEMLSKGSQLDKLANSFREVSMALKALTKISPSSSL